MDPRAGRSVVSADPVWPDLVEWGFIAAACVLTALLGGALWFLRREMKKEEGAPHDG